MTDTLAITQISFFPSPLILSALSVHFLYFLCCFLAHRSLLPAPFPVLLHFLSVLPTTWAYGGCWVVRDCGPQETWGGGCSARPLSQRGGSPCEACFNFCSRCPLYFSLIFNFFQVPECPPRGCPLRDRCQLIWSHTLGREAMLLQGCGRVHTSCQSWESLCFLILYPLSILLTLASVSSWPIWGNI